MSLLGLLALVIVGAIVAFIAKLKLRGQLQQNLGRKVDDLELNSINAWMEVDRRKDQATARMSNDQATGTSSNQTTSRLSQNQEAAQGSSNQGTETAFSIQTSTPTKSAEDRLIPLTDDERLILTRKRNGQLIQIPLLVFVALIILPSILIGGIFICGGLVLSLSLGAKALHSLVVVMNLQSDLRAGQKRVITAPVEDQNMDVSRTQGYGGAEGSASYVFWVKAGGHKLSVSEEQYYQIKKGDLVEAYLAPNSGTVFGVTCSF